MSHSTDQRVLVALGGNALTPHGHAGPEAQRAAVERAMQQVADLVAAGDDIGLTHRNGPQVGNLLTKNELARSVVPPVPLDWCVAQTRWLGRTTPGELRALCREGHFAVGSMGPKVEACVRFVEAGGAHAVIAPLDRIVEAAERRVGTVVERSREAA